MLCSCCACHVWRPRDARAYIRPLAEHQVAHLPRKSQRQSGGDQRTPGRTSDPLLSTKCRACHAKATSRATETKGRHGVHPTPCSAPSPTPVIQKPPAERRRPRDARAYIRPLAEHQVPHLPRKSQAAETKGHQGVHPTPCSAPSPKPATQKPPAERRRHRDARAYIRPLGEHQVPRLPRKSHRQSGGDQWTPGRTSDPLQSTKWRTCHAKATGRAAETKGRQGVHPTPCSAPSPTPATQKPPAERRRPRDARPYTRPLAVHQVPRLPRKSHRQSGGDQGTPGRTSDPLLSTKSHTCHAKAKRRRPRDTRAYIRPLAVHQVPRLPRKSHRQSGGDQGTPWRTPDPLQCTKSHTCHAKATGRAAETKGRQGVHPTPCSAPSPTPASQKPPTERRRPRDAPGRTSDPLQCTKSHACHAKATNRAAETKSHACHAKDTPCLKNILQGYPD